LDSTKKSPENQPFTPDKALVNKLDKRGNLFGFCTAENEPDTRSAGIASREKSLERSF
jgi:hypothetical protein